MELEKELETLMREEGVKDKLMQFYRYLDIRYAGQEYSVSVPIPQGTAPVPQNAERFRQDFHGLYQQTYGHSNPDEKVELANIRVEARGRITAHQEELQAKLVTEADKAQSSRNHSVYFDGRHWDTQFMHRTKLSTEETLQGPLVIVEKSCTTVVPPEYTVQLDRYRNLIIEKQKGGQNI